MPLAPPSLFNTQSSTGWWRRDVWQAAASVCSLMPASACWCGVSRLLPYTAASPVGSGIKGSFFVAQGRIFICARASLNARPPERAMMDAAQYQSKELSFVDHWCVHYRLDPIKSTLLQWEPRSMTVSRSSSKCPNKIANNWSLAEKLWFWNNPLFALNSLNVED